jgi:uncharacterized protein (DUF1800 family)
MSASPGVAAALAPQRDAAAAAPLPQAAASISAELIALNRIGYGPRPANSSLTSDPASFPGDLARVQQLGLDAYIEQQLNPETIDDSFCESKILEARLETANGVSPLNYLNSPVTALWNLTDFGMSMDYSERMRPWYEVRAAAVIRAIYSERQLVEVLVDFWHNHFSVNAGADVAHSVGFPDYDRIMRQYCLGNFREFVEAVGKSTSMMYSLDNYSNRAGGGEAGNENYARELFELHTLGSDNYLKFYDDRSQIGTIEYNGETFARGYIDKDVYEAAECFTGWSIANGDWRLPDPRPDTGEFIYVPSWHSSGLKRVLGQDIDNGPSVADYMKDGRQVYDLVCRHIGTARYLCTKLCRRLIADNPPADVIEAAVAEWMAHRDSSDQIKRVVRVILNSNAFRSTWGQKVKRPFDFLISYIRATGAVLPLVDTTASDGDRWNGLFWNLGNTGHRLYEWPTPTGYPDLASYWLSTNGMLRRWNLPYLLTVSWSEIGAQLDLLAQTDTSRTCTQIVDDWIDKLYGYAVSANTRTTLINFLAQGGNVDAAPVRLSGESTLKERIECMVHLMAMAPEFQLR